MSSEAWVATRKGLFKVAGSDSDWKIVGRSFVGETTSVSLRTMVRQMLFMRVSITDTSEPSCIARITTGKIGQRSPAQSYPEQPEGWEEPANPLTGKVTP